MCVVCELRRREDPQSKAASEKHPLHHLAQAVATSGPLERSVIVTFSVSIGYLLKFLGSGSPYPANEIC